MSRALCFLLLPLLLGCGPQADDSSFIGMNFSGHLIDWNVDWEGGSWLASNRVLEESFEGDLGAEGDSVEGMRESSDGDWFVHRQGRGFATSASTGESGISLGFAVSTDVDIDAYAPLVQGRYTCVRWRDAAAPESDIVFLMLHDSDFALQVHDSESTHIETFGYGDSTVELGEGDLEGTWQVVGESQQEIVLESGGETWAGVFFPGTSLMIASPVGEGVLSCLWSPLPNTQLSVFDGDFYFLESLRTTDGFSAAQPAQIDIFGDAGIYTRDPGGEAEQVFDLSGRSQVYFVGNAISWQSTPESWVYQIAVSDFYLQWTQVGGAPGPDAPPTYMESFGVGFHPRALHDLQEG